MTFIKNNVIKNSLLILLAFGLLYGCVDTRPDTRPEAEIKTVIPVLEKLVAANIETQSPFWCDSGKSLIYTKTNDGVFRHNVKSGEAKLAAEPRLLPLACTPDGEWLILFDKESLRYDIETNKRGVVDLWRYEFKTGIGERFAVADDNEVSALGSTIISPDGTKLYLGKQPTEEIDQPEPAWDIVWADTELRCEPAWLPDSSGIIEFTTIFQEETTNLVLHLTEDEKKRIAEDKIELWPPLNSCPRQVRTSIQGGRDSFFHKAVGIKKCEIEREDGSFNCTGLFKRPRLIEDYAILADGRSIVFIEEERGCVMIKQGEAEARCLSKEGYELDGYLKVSPNGRYVIFTAYEYDAINLYVVEIKSER